MFSISSILYICQMEADKGFFWNPRAGSVVGPKQGLEPETGNHLELGQLLSLCLSFSMPFSTSLLFSTLLSLSFSLSLSSDGFSLLFCT